MASETPTALPSPPDAARNAVVQNQIEAAAPSALRPRPPPPAAPRLRPARRGMPSSDGAAHAAGAGHAPAAVAQEASAVDDIATLEAMLDAPTLPHSLSVPHKHAKLPSDGDDGTTRRKTGMVGTQPSGVSCSVSAARVLGAGEGALVRCLTITPLPSQDQVFGLPLLSATRRIPSMQRFTSSTRRKRSERGPGRAHCANELAGTEWTARTAACAWRAKHASGAARASVGVLPAAGRPSAQ